MPSNIVVPEVGESIVDARVAKWLRKEGDAVAFGDPLVELETDKVDVEVAATQAGVLTRIDRRDGDDVKVGEVLGMTEDSAAGVSPGAPAPAAPKDAVPAANVPDGQDKPAALKVPAETKPSEKTRATP